MRPTYPDWLIAAARENPFVWHAISISGQQNLTTEKTIELVCQELIRQNDILFKHAAELASRVPPTVVMP